MRKTFLFFIILFLISIKISGQRFPSILENIKFLVTFSEKSNPTWGDNDYKQTVFIVIPAHYRLPFFIRVFDPDLGGEFDEKHGEFDSQTSFSIYGSEGVFSNYDPIADREGRGKEARLLLSQKIFDNSNEFDNKWYTFGPFNPKKGEFSSQYNGYIFKIVIKGMKGDDGNLYYFFTSKYPNSNKEIEGSNGFSYEYCFRVSKFDPNQKNVIHIYPFVDENTISIMLYNFDYDNDGNILLYSISKNREIAKKSGDGRWEKSKHMITKEEKNTSIDISFVTRKGSKNNNMVIYITNQYNQFMPFFNLPLGGAPKYKIKTKIRYKRNR